MIIQETNPIEMASLFVVYDNLSPLDESEGRRGISHFIEHMMGKAVDSLLPQIHELGISDDFCTNYEHVKASFSGTADAMEKIAPSIVRQIVFSDADCFTEEDFECERHAIINEITQIFSDTIHETLRDCRQKTFGICGPEGLLDDVRAYTFDEFKKDYARIVPHPSRIVYVGPRKIQFPEIEFSGSGNFKSIAPGIRDEKAVEISEANDEYKTIIFVGTEPIVGNRDYAAMTLAVHMLAGNDESVLFERLRLKEGLVYGCFGTLEPLRNAGIQYFHTGTSAQNIGKVASIMTEILENPERHLTEKLFAEARNYFRNTLKAAEILRFCNANDLVRNGMITYERDILNIEYPELLAITAKYFGHGKIRSFLG